MKEENSYLHQFMLRKQYKTPIHDKNPKKNGKWGHPHLDKKTSSKNL